MLHTFSSNLLPKQNIKLLKFTNATRLILEALENVACAHTPQRFNQMTTIHVNAELTMTKSLPMCVRSLSFHVFVIMADPPPPAQLREVLTRGGGWSYNDSNLSVRCDGENNSRLINGLELEHSTGTP